MNYNDELHVNIIDLINIEMKKVHINGQCFTTMCKLYNLKF